VPQANVPSAAGFLLSRIAAALRRGHPCGGVIFLEYKFSDAIRNYLSAEMFQPLPTTSNGNGELMGIIDQAVDANPDFVFTHEVAHCFWLTHHENARGEVKQHHDQFDHNCMMSYPYWGIGAPPYPHQAPNLYDPTFCGKCNLKLRGWDITHADILALDAPTPPDNLVALFYYDRADPGLRWGTELATVRGAFTSVSRGLFRERNFNRNAHFATWMRELGDCDVYHHVTHGNVRCSRDRVRLASMTVATPRYPTWCRSDPNKVNALDKSEHDLCVSYKFNRTRLEGWARDSLITTSTWFHNLYSVIQWRVVDDDPNQDIEFTYEQIQTAFNGGTNAPRLLAFFSSCLLGWEKRFAKLFLDQGTPYVVAFRSRYETLQALEFSSIFYDTLKRGVFNRTAIKGAFLQAATQRPHAEPCLFSAAGIIRCVASTMETNSGDVQDIAWDNDDAFYAPRFPKR